jgi:hypothetical protein
MSLLEIIDLSIKYHNDFVFKFIDKNEFINLFTLSKSFRCVCKKTKNLCINPKLLLKIFGLDSYYIKNNNFLKNNINIDIFQKIKKVFPFLHLDIKLEIENMFLVELFFNIYRFVLNLFDSIKLELNVFDIIKDLSFLNNLQNINFLSLSTSYFNNVSLTQIVNSIDLTPLSNLKKISLKGVNNLSDITALKNVEELRIEETNNISDISCLKKIKKLNIFNCDGIKIIPRITTLEELVLGQKNCTLLNFLPNIKILRIYGKFNLIEPNIFSDTLLEELYISRNYNSKLSVETSIFKYIKKNIIYY